VTLSIATLNLHCGIGYQVADAVAALDTDIVLLQENWRPDGGPSLAELAAAACGYPERAELDLVGGHTLAELEVTKAPSPRGTWGLAVLSRVPWQSSSTVSLGAAPGDVVGERHAQVVAFPGLRVVNVHLTHRLPHGPAQLRRLVAGLAGPTVPTVVGGDFNMCRPLIRLGRPYRPAIRGRSFPAQLPLAQIDHLLAGPGVTVSAGRVGPGVGSDHRPLLATVTVPAGSVSGAGKSGAADHRRGGTTAPSTGHTP
jgi:endonuclease/exonuclease/phosphatase family metal-dependent hydrolase